MSTRPLLRRSLPIRRRRSRKPTCQRTRQPTPRIDGRLDDKSTAPKQGIGNSTQLAKVSWEKKLMAHFKKHLIYPQGVKAKDAKVRVILDVEFDRIGHVVSASIAEGSGQPAFDE